MVCSPPFPSLLFTFFSLSFFDQLQSTATQPLSPKSSALWIIAAASSLASLPPSGLLFYCPHRVSFQYLNQNLLLFCATPSSGFSSHSEHSVAPAVTCRALCELFSGKNLTWLPSALSLTHFAPATKAS